MNINMELRWDPTLPPATFTTLNERGLLTVHIDPELHNEIGTPGVIQVNIAPIIVADNGALGQDQPSGDPLVVGGTSNPGEPSQ
jgi:hypothetical protein